MIFEPFTIGSHTAKNRMVRSATNDHLGHVDGSLSQEQLDLYEELAKNQVGTIITGHFGVSENHRAAFNQPLATREDFLPGMRRMVEVCHNHGALIYAQISNGGRKSWQTPLDILTLELSEIPGIVREFIQAAVICQKAGFDGVQVHLAHGYFLADVLDPHYNQRMDEYGGSPENRFRMVREIITGIRAACSEDFDILVKLHAHPAALWTKEMNSSIDRASEAMDWEDLLYYGRELQSLGVSAIEVSGWDFAAHSGAEASYYIREAAALQQHLTVPIMLVGGLDTRQRMEDALAAGIPLVSLCRAFICEPDFVKKLAEGQEKSRCVHCRQCFKLHKSQYKNCVFLPESEQLKMLGSIL